VASTIRSTTARRRSRRPAFAELIVRRLHPAIKDCRARDWSLTHDYRDIS
jgi:hypothetical protein